MMLMNILETRSTTARRSARSRARRSARRVSRRPVVHSWILRRFGPRRARFPELRVEFRERRRRGPGAGATWPRDARRRADAVAALRDASPDLGSARRRRGGAGLAPLDAVRGAAPAPPAAAEHARRPEGASTHTASQKRLLREAGATTRASF